MFNNNLLLSIMKTSLRVIFAALLWVLFIYISAFFNISIFKDTTKDNLILLAGVIILILGISFYYFLYPVKSRKSIFAKVISYGFIGLFIFIIFNLRPFEASNDRAKISSIKANMHKLQTMLETYGVDYGGYYPNNLSELYKEGVAKNYWEDFNNPLSGNIDQAWMSSIPLEAVNQKAGKLKNIIPGSVIYKPTKDKGKINGYYIYGASRTKDSLILDGEKTYYLTN